MPTKREDFVARDVLVWPARDDVTSVVLTLASSCARDPPLRMGATSLYFILLLLLWTNSGS